MSDYDKYQLNYAHSCFYWPVNSPISNLVPEAVPVLSVTFFSEFLLSGYEPHCFLPRKRKNKQTKKTKNQHKESEAKICIENECLGGRGGRRAAGLAAHLMRRG